ncbi:esterase-like activity of phytase family protein [uncultured Roseobacter sp.]|uniref:esterase-like activity of phytase family protein n=1 Tax=uncultured Roseobacter sp. TaxID=114847 RepID=UPI0026252A7E|nr:esterase-like activity of phytase family protein [uncultured Roseobacter sp.]
MLYRVISMASTVALMSSAVAAEMNFNRISSFPTTGNNEDVTAESSAEIVGVSGDGMTLAYSDSPLGAVGFIDITDPVAPAPAGRILLDGEPTAVSLTGNTALVAINTSESYTAPSGILVSYDIRTRVRTATCNLGGQPDSTAVSPDGTFIAVAIENERNEDAGDGRTGQAPGGFIVTFDIDKDGADCDSMVKIDVTGLAGISPEDPEPEFVDINALGEIVVTLQENNHIVVASAAGDILSHFSAGSVDLEDIDTTDERGALIFTQSQTGRLREPDGVQWIDDAHFATANEGDMDGGARGWTIFHKDGTVVYESGNSFEHAIIRAGHYPDKRSDSKGVEPEGMEFAVIGGIPYLFVLAEHASIVGVYDVSDPSAPVLRQLLPSGIGPEGAVAIPARNLFVTANETDLTGSGGIRSHVMIYALQDGPARYPQLTSAGADHLIGWGAISGMVAGEDGLIYAVNDSFYGYQPTIFTIDTRVFPARIINALPVTRAGRPAQKLDLEGITLDSDGGFWLASEGRTDRLIPHALYRVDTTGEIREEISLPAELLAAEKRFGFEGITRAGETLWMAVQREWADDPENRVKLVSYNTQTGAWGAVHHPKAAVEKGWVGLSEISFAGDFFYVIERDNQIGPDATVKRIYRIPADDMVPASLGSTLPVVGRELVYDMIPDLRDHGGFVVDKVEGLAILGDGQAWISTDNDGVDDSSGETFFWSPGRF